MLSRRWLVNGLLMLVITILAAIGYRLERTPEPQPPAAHSDFDAAAVERIEIRTANERLVLQKQPSGWMLFEPLHWPASRAAVERLFRIVDTGVTRPLEAAAIDLARFGLDNPQAAVQFGDIAIRFGGVNSIGGRRYTQIDSALFLLPDVDLPLIQQGAAGFIDRRLLPPAFGVTALSLPELELRRDADGNWRSVEGDTTRTGTLDTLVDNWQRLEATRIGVYQDPRAPIGRIVAKLRDAEPIELLLLATDPELVIANPGLGLQYHFRGELYDRLFSPVDD